MGCSRVSNSEDLWVVECVAATPIKFKDYYTEEVLKCYFRCVYQGGNGFRHVRKKHATQLEMELAYLHDISINTFQNTKR
jgi:hypothetical protein